MTKRDYVTIDLETYDELVENKTKLDILLKHIFDKSQLSYDEKHLFFSIDEVIVKTLFSNDYDTTFQEVKGAKEDE